MEAVPRLNPMALSYEEEKELVPLKECGGIEYLVPITLSMTIEGLNIHDAFLWNIHETEITPFMFAKLFVGDLGLPDKCITPIAQNITTQIERHRNGLDFENKSGYLYSDNPNNWYIPYPPRDAEPKESKLCTIQINITLNDITVMDQFEWDLYADERLNSPERFARVFCTDLGLPREFQVAISHSIREQIMAHRKLDYSGELKDRPVITEALRAYPDTNNWTPTATYKSRSDF